MFLNTQSFKNHTIKRKATTKDEFFICAIDPGVVNTSVYIEKRSKENIITLEEFKLINCQNEYDKLTHELDKFIYLDKCDYVLVESQLSRNPKALRLMQHIISYLLIKTKSPLIIEISPKFKTQTFKAPRMKSKDAKKWAITKATELLTLRNDDFALELFNKMKKKDDIADTICYCEAWFLSDEKLKC